MKTEAIKEKFGKLFGKIGRKTIIIASSVLIIAVAVILNFILLGKDSEGKLKPAIDLTDTGDVSAGENADSEDYFASMSLSRRQARDEAISVLQNVVDSDTAVEEMKTDAMADMQRIADNIEVEANIESLVVSKGFTGCIAVVNGDTASVIVPSEGLLPGEISQISEIVYEQAGVLPVNLNIIEKNG